MTASAGILRTAGGYVSNAATGTITSDAGLGVDFRGAAGTLINAGEITASGTKDAVALNAGRAHQQCHGRANPEQRVDRDLRRRRSGYGHQCRNDPRRGRGRRQRRRSEGGGFVSNAATGTIISTGSHNAVYLGVAPGGTVVNAGLISATAYNGVELNNGGTLVNSGSINGGLRGVIVRGMSGNLVNSGTVPEYQHPFGRRPPRRRPAYERGWRPDPECRRQRGLCRGCLGQ